MKLVPIIITEEIIGDLDEFSITASAQLDLDSGDINIQSYYRLNKDEEGNTLSKEEYDLKLHGLPSHHKEYCFSSGLLNIGDKELEFAININKKTNAYEVDVCELAEIKDKALALATVKPLKKTTKKK
jgi:hypothetical protein